MRRVAGVLQEVRLRLPNSPPGRACPVSEVRQNPFEEESCNEPLTSDALPHPVDLG